MDDDSIINAAKEYEKSTCFGDIVLKAKGVNSAAGIGFLEGAVWARKQIMEDVYTIEVKEADLEKDVRQILSLYYEGIKYYEDVIRKEREENGGSDLAIKIMDGIADARELGIQYVIDKLKAQKGEGV